MVDHLIEPGSESRVHRNWFVDSAMDSRMEETFEVADKDRRLRCRPSQH